MDVSETYPLHCDSHLSSLLIGQLGQKNSETLTADFEIAKRKMNYPLFRSRFERQCIRSIAAARGGQGKLQEGSVGRLTLTAVLGQRNK